MTRFEQIKQSLEWPRSGPSREDSKLLVDFVDAFLRWDDEPDDTQYLRWRELQGCINPLLEEVAA